MSKESQKSQGTHQEKLNKGSILVVDIAAIPREHGLDIEKWAYLLREQGVAFYDSSKGNVPFYTQPDETIKVYDVQEEEAMAELEALLKEDDKKYEGSSNELEFDSVNHLDTNNLTTGTGTGEEVTSVEIGPGIVTQLTTQDVGDLEVHDPRGGDGLEDREHDLIDRVMAAQPAPRLRSGNFNLIDDTE